ncbi:uncharacterized protein Bfra_001193 [Botrytis fragariae]|uniref:Uncharacterized protein n=1 Tax=Botrytis fragariae TaxID=1964551 RepID=A0A8H6ELS2_9HELO|nr:uncharacterized protein Bfra_001193 [Botrytis fragariae]KAF5876839.1 hypothetical protein Bfra_001193 [Botrytis fragariae]
MINKPLHQDAIDYHTGKRFLVFLMEIRREWSYAEQPLATLTNIRLFNLKYSLFSSVARDI